MDYAACAQMAKALSDETRLKIVDMLSCGELCACNLLEHLEISQPTLSYHMKMLCASGLVVCEKRGSWAHYRLVDERFAEFTAYLEWLSHEKENCICHATAPKEVTSRVG